VYCLANTRKWPREPGKAADADGDQEMWLSGAHVPRGASVTATCSCKRREDLGTESESKRPTRAPSGGISQLRRLFFFCSLCKLQPVWKKTAQTGGHLRWLAPSTSAFGICRPEAEMPNAPPTVQFAHVSSLHTRRNNEAYRCRRAANDLPKRDCGGLHGVGESRWLRDCGRASVTPSMSGYGC
jgi:hypothetical protein